MTWPAPNPFPPPNASTLVETSDERAARSGLPAATWIALLGGVLVLLAASSIVVSSWDALGRSVRVGGLIVGTVGLLLASERLRRVVPVTATIIAHVGTFLIMAVGVAATSLFGFTWPACLLVGGILTTIATAYQATRWTPVFFHAGQVGAICLAATGLAALTGTTGGLIAAVVAVGMVAVGADRRAVGLAVAAALSPALVVLGDAGIGYGTFARAGLVGDRLIWSGPVVGVLVAIVLGVVGRRRNNDALLVAAVVAPVFGVVTGLASSHVDRAWMSAAWMVLGLEVAVFGLVRRRRELIISGSVVAAFSAVSLWFTTDLHTWADRLVAPLDITAGDAWMLFVTTAALVVGFVVRRTTGPSSWVAYGPGLTVGGLWLISAELDRSPVWAIPAALTLGLVATAAGAWHRLGAPLTIGTAVTVAATFTALGSDLTAIPTWMWLGAGGLVLMGVAATIERTSKHGTSLKDLVDRWG